ncbi:MAG: ferritin [Candidatus Omnitrophota bacterium]
MEKKLEKALQEQIKNELYSSYLYLSMASYADTNNLPGFGHWFKIQAKEEHAHAMKFYEYLIDRGVRVLLQAIPEPDAEFASCLDLFEGTLAHEKKVTAMIEKLCLLAEEAKDYATLAILQWFITEQVEEEKNATAILEDLKKLKAGPSAGLIMLDRELAKREG